MAAKSKQPSPGPRGEGHYIKLSSCFSGLVDRQDRLVGQFTESRPYREAWRAATCSDSSAVTVANWPKLSQSRGSLKHHVRAGVSPAVRKELWLFVSEVSDDDSVLFAKAFGEPADGTNAQRPLRAVIERY
jgi:hypothetical protein